MPLGIPKDVGIKANLFVDFGAVGTLMKRLTTLKMILHFEQLLG